MIKAKVKGKFNFIENEDANVLDKTDSRECVVYQSNIKIDGSREELMSDIGILGVNVIRECLFNRDEESQENLPDILYIGDSIAKIVTVIVKNTRELVKDSSDTEFETAVVAALISNGEFPGLEKQLRKKF